MIVIAHGSREEESNQAFLDFIDKFRKSEDNKFVQPAFLELFKPTIPQAIDLCVEEGAEEIMVVPFMLLPGKHVKTHIPEFIQQAKMKYPQLDFHYTGPLADHPGMLDILAHKAATKRG